MIIQNLACFEVDIAAGSKRVYFAESILQGKKIRDIFVFVAADNSDALYSPFAFSEDSNAPLSAYAGIEMFFNLVDANGKTFAENLTAQDFVKSTSNHNTRAVRSIDKIIDTEKSYIKISTASATAYKFLVYVSYEIEKQGFVSERVNGAFGVEIPESAAFQSLRLSNIIPREKCDLPIKKIRVLAENGEAIGAFITLKNEDGIKLIECLPLSLLQYEVSNKYGKVNEIALDNFTIDYENSYIYTRNATEGYYLNFIY
jgi:hypothetical protein